MRKLLIADRSDDQCAVLKKALQKDFAVSTCNDGLTALTLIKGMRPDALVLDLSLPHLDGLTILQELQGSLPAAILATTDFTSGYVQHRAVELGIGYIMLRPFHPRCICGHILNLLNYAGSAAAQPQSVTAARLSRLGLSSSHDGYQQLLVGIPLFAQDPSMRLGKELYPAIASVLGNASAKAVEHTVRTAIEAAWSKRDAGVWEEYFSGCEKCPNNKKFISRLAQFTDYPND